MANTSDEATTVAGRFLSARRDAQSLAGYPGEMPQTLGQAYKIQDEAISRWGKPVLGWKVGRVNPPFSDVHGTDRLAGPIFHVVEDPASTSTVPMPVFEGGFAAGEAEFLCRIGEPPPRDKDSFTLEEAARLIESIHVGIEIASSPLSTINELGPIAVISDFGNNNGLVVGPAIPNWQQSGFEDWAVATFVDEVEVGRGTASNFPDGAIGAVRFLFELMAERGIPLRAGQWISTGAVTGVHDAAPGQLVEARFADDLWLACKFVEARPQGGK